MSGLSTSAWPCGELAEDDLREPLGRIGPKRSIARCSARIVASPETGDFSDDLKIDGIAADQRVGRVPGEYRRGEVEGGDHRDHA